MEKAKPNKILHTHEEEDRISQLPEELLHRILYFLDGLKTAAKTCVLSKSWRYVWCTNPKLNLSSDLVSAVDRILQSYHDRNLCLDEFSLLIMVMSNDNKEALLLNKWIPIIVQHMRVKTFHLSLIKRNENSFELPSSILESDHIRKLTILGEPAGCMFQSSSLVVNLKHLQTLWLCTVHIPEHILESILSSCLFLERVSLERCRGFTRVKLQQPTKNLKAFYFRGNYNDDTIDDVTIEIAGDHIPTLETIKLLDCLFTVSPDVPFEYASLTDLSLTRVKLSSEFFWCNLQSLEELKLDQCTGIEEFKLSSRSMKRLEINNSSEVPFKATIDAPSMVSFNYEGILPQSISFATTSSDDHLWKSNINLYLDEHSYCFKELYGLLKALSQSEISLALNQAEIHRFRTQLGSKKNEETKQLQLPVVVEKLMIEGSEEIMHSSAASFLNMLCHMFRPSFVYMDDRDVLIVMYNEHRKIAELVLKEIETGQSYFWPRDLEGASLQVLHRNKREWEHTSFAQLRKKGADGRKLELRIRLKWRD